MRRHKDPDKKAVYHAERQTFEETLFTEPLHSDDFMTIADRLFSHDWWERHKIPVPIIEPTTYADHTSYAWLRIGQEGKDPVIRIAPHDINAWILTHEAAHVAQYHFYKPDSYGLIEMHGREFRATYMSVAEIVLGRDAVGSLRANFDTFIKLRPEHAPGMPGSIMCVPRGNPEHDPGGYGIYPTWRLEKQAKDLAAISPVVCYTPRINGAIAL